MLLQIISLYLVKSDNRSVLNFFLALKFLILNINMELKIIKDKGVLFHWTLLKFFLRVTENLKPSSLNFQELHVSMCNGACGLLI
jgi:hypothetical protein